MSKKAVYNNKMLAIYISGDDFKDLLRRTDLSVPVYIGKVKSDSDWIMVNLLGKLRVDLDNAYQLEHEAIEAARSQVAKDKFRSPAYLEKHRSKKNA